MTAIKFLLGDSQQDNLKYYIRKNYRLLNILRREINHTAAKNQFTTEGENQSSTDRKGTPVQ